jgi:hypothetical protein
MAQRTQQRLLRFLGQLMGLALRTRAPLPLNLAPMVWMQLVRAEVGAADLRRVDAGACKDFMDPDRNGTVTADTFEDCFPDWSWTVDGEPDGEEVVPGGAGMVVSFEGARGYVDAVRRHHLHAADGAVQLVREGLGSVVPLRWLSLWTGPELERAVAGDPAICVARLRAHTEYEYPLTAGNRECLLLWEVLESFSPQQRSLFLRFVWGRSRLPLTDSGSAWRPFKLSRRGADEPDRAFPVSHTCSFQLELPAYTEAAAARERILYAIENCREVDADGAMSSAREAMEAPGVWE